MCGIVGLLLLDRDLEPQLGRLLTAMLVQMTERRSGLGGVAVYADGLPEACRKYSCRADGRADGPAGAVDWPALAAEIGASATTFGRAAVLIGPAGHREELEARGLTVVSSGRDLEVFKGVGLPVDISKSTTCRHAMDTSASATPAWPRSPP